jgi:hypothetical protein
LRSALSQRLASLLRFSRAVADLSFLDMILPPICL